MTAAKAAAKKAASARGRDQWMRATLVCRDPLVLKILFSNALLVDTEDNKA
jgi:hypothetical protein